MGRPVTAARRHPLIPPREVDPRQELPRSSSRCSSAGASATCSRSRCARARARRDWVFYEGPPTANGPPGSHHVLSRVFKDIYPRFQTMRGYRVARKGGWDCHGLPVEIAVEKQLGITARRRSRTEAVSGSSASTASAASRCSRYLEEWNRLTERIGFWIDLEHAYRTLDESYIEWVWWALSEIDRRGLLYEGHKVVPYCPRCGTTLSSHEVALGYKDTVDPSVYMRAARWRTARSGCSCGRRRHGRCRATSRWRSRRRATYARVRAGR